MASLATDFRRDRSMAVNDANTITDDEAWTAFDRRDRSWDGRVIGGVKTTGIYCRPSCPARRPKRENVEFFPDGAAARAAGYRACLRCLPDEVNREEVALGKVFALLEASDEAPSLESLAAAVGYSPHHFHRLFKRATGVSSRLGMTPSAWRDGGRGETISWASAETDLGNMLVAATGKGICRLSFDEDEAALRRRFPNAAIAHGGAEMADLVRRTVAAVNAPEKPHDLPLDVQGTAFQEAVWRELSRIPAGETRTYAQIAAAVGRPAAVRAAGSANGANNVAVLIPCHRVIRTDGTPGGYAYGLERKAKLLQRERGGG